MGNNVRDKLGTPRVTGNVLLAGAPGTGAVRRARDLVPDDPLSDHERRWLEAEYEGAGLGDVAGRPFRAPHHSVSTAGLCGARLRSGEVRLARFGVLYLDELMEFRTEALNYLAHALTLMRETRPVVVASSPACPCGWSGSSVLDCTCPKVTRGIYQKRLQGRCQLLQIDRTINLNLTS